MGSVDLKERVEKNDLSSPPCADTAGRQPSTHQGEGFAPNDESAGTLIVDLPGSRTTVVCYHSPAD